MANVVVNGEAHRAFDPDDETVDLSGLTGALTVQVNYRSTGRDG